MLNDSIDQWQKAWETANGQDDEQAMKADLPRKAIQAIAGAMSSHTSMATQLLSDKATRDVFITVLYELLRKDAGADLIEKSRQS